MPDTKTKTLKTTKGTVVKKVVSKSMLDMLNEAPQIVQKKGTSFSIDRYLNDFAPELKPIPPAPGLNDFLDYRHTTSSPFELVEYLPWKKLRKPLNVEKFTAFVKQRLDNMVRGYCVHVLQGSKTVCTISKDLALNKIDGHRRFDNATRVHLASTSKFITAIALAKALKEKGIPFSATIEKYLPAYWSLSTDNKKVTFHHLLTHTSGFRWEGSSQNFENLRYILMSGNKNIGIYDYCNANFGIIRILLPIITGAMYRSLFKGWSGMSTPLEEVIKQLRTTIWDSATVHAFKDYVLRNIFEPSGVKYCITDPDLSKIPGYPVQMRNNKAFGYRGPDDEDRGMNSGDLAGILGGVGFRLTAFEYARILKKFMTSSQILRKEDRETLLRNNYGIASITTIRGTGYRHNGVWGGGGCAEESSINIFPDSVYIVGLCSSEPKGVHGGLEGTILEAYNHAMVD